MFCKRVAAFVALALPLAAADATFYLNTLSTLTRGGEEKVELTISNGQLVIQGRKEGATQLTIPYDSVKAFTYFSPSHHRYKSGAAVAALSPLTGIIVMSTKGNSHWLVISYSGANGPTDAVLHLDKREVDDVLGALRAQSGKAVEVGIATDPALNPAFESKDVRELLPFTVDQVRAALKPAMESVGCKVTDAPPGQIRCIREGGHSDRTGNGGGLLATLSEEASQTRLFLQSQKTAVTSKNWAGPVFLALKKNLGMSPPIEAKP